MKTQELKPFVLLACIAILSTVIITKLRVSTAEEIPAFAPLAPTSFPEAVPFQTEEGVWIMPASAAPTTNAPLSSQGTGGPDDFGYTWNDNVPLSWIDATSGTDTGMSGSSSNQKTGPIPLLFSFPFYENAYNELYIAASGYVGFTDDGSWPWQPHIPSIAIPNNLIAPYASPFNLTPIGPASRVFYKSGGTAPNRYFVVEWYQVSFDFHGNFTFEVILHENGDIVFQYQNMDYGNGWACGGAGIENSSGYDGLPYGTYCAQWTPNKAVRFYRPAPSARVSITPRNLGSFTYAGETTSLTLSIKNTGELGPDTYDLSFVSNWPVTLYQSDGTTPLTDTDTDGIIDTGSLSPGAEATIVAKIQTPESGTLGSANTVNLTGRSSINANKSHTVPLQTAIAAPFRQSFRDGIDNAMSLHMVQPKFEVTQKVTGDNYFGYYPGIAESPNTGNVVYVWQKGRCLTPDCAIYVYEIEYAILDKYGNTLLSPRKLTDHSKATGNAYDYPVAAVAPNGNIGVLWYRTLSNPNNGQANSNILFAVLDAQGNPLSGPTNITNNDLWGSYDSLNVPVFYSPQIAATSDNRFVLSWGKSYRTPPENNCYTYCYFNDIYLAVRDTNGGSIKTPVQITSGTPDGSAHYNPNLAALNNNRVLLTWSHFSEIYYAVFNSNGSTAKSETALSTDGYENYDWKPDAVQLSGGNIAIVWSVTGYPEVNYMRYAMLDSNYARVSGPTRLSNPATVSGDYYPSVAADTHNHAIVTWTDQDYSSRYNLFYALLHGNGSVTTSPMKIYTSEAATPSLLISYEGYGNTSFSWTPAEGVDGDVSPGATLVGGAAGGGAGIDIRYANYGATTATGVVLTATLPLSVTYASDSLGLTPTIAGNTVTWHLPDMSLLDQGRFTLWVNLPAVELGTRYTVTLSWHAGNGEADPVNNTANVEIMVANQIFMPINARN